MFHTDSIPTSSSLIVILTPNCQHANKCLTVLVQQNWIPALHFPQIASDVRIQEGKVGKTKHYEVNTERLEKKQNVNMFCTFF